MGVVIFGHQTDLLTSWAWLWVGLVSAMTLYFTSAFLAFFGGLVLAIYTASLWPHLTKRVIKYPPHRVIPIAMVVMFAYIVLSVWVVAFNFVPGGVFTRERTDVLLLLLVFSCGLGTCNFSRQQAEVEVPKSPKRRVKENKVNIIGRVIRRLSTITELEEEEPNSFTKQVTDLSY